MPTNNPDVTNWVKRLRKNYIYDPPSLFQQNTMTKTYNTGNQNEIIGVIGQANKLSGDMEAHLSQLYKTPLKETDAKKHC